MDGMEEKAFIVYFSHQHNIVARERERDREKESEREQSHAEG